MNVSSVVIAGQNQVELRQAGVDLTPGDDQILVETEFTYISAGTELSIYTGLDSATTRPGSWCCYPWSAGYANVGIAREVGAAVKSVQPGQRVFSFGGHTSHFVIKPDPPGGALVVPVPESVEPHLAAASRMAGVAFTGPYVAAKTLNRWVAVFGLGTVGNLAAQIFGLEGCRVIGIDPSPHRRDLAQACGVPHALGGSPQEIDDGISEITGGALVETAVDAVGDSRVIMHCLRSVRPHGEVVILGTPRAPVSGDLTEVFAKSHSSWITIKGALEWLMPVYPVATYSGETLAGKHAKIFDWILRGKLKLEPLVSHTIVPAQITEAYEGLLHRKDEYIGVVIDWREL